MTAANGARPEVGGAGGVVNEQKVDLLLDMLKSADVTDTSKEESKTVKELESELMEKWKREKERERERERECSLSLRNAATSH